jgi:Zn-dependent peptidase ImmA (M78 family)
LKVEQNISRLNYLLSLYGMTMDDLLSTINKGRKHLITQNEVFSKDIDISILKKIDKIFDKGLHFYLDPKTLEQTAEASIFFRKNSFGTELNIGARKIVTQFEDFKISFSAIAKLADVNLNRNLPVYNIGQSVKNVANQLRKLIYPNHQTKTRKDFLTAIIGKLAERNILVFEFVETWNKKEKANIDGFFLCPNVIVLKRNQNAFNREIFTLLHELGHYLLNEEEIEQVDVLNTVNSNLSEVERWCNDFAYYFLAGDYSAIIDNMDMADASNDYYHETIEEISQKVNLSRIALYTRLLLQGKISPHNYNLVKTDLDEQYHNWLQEKKKERDLKKEDGRKQGGSSPIPIKSPLLISTIQTAFYEGVINESEVCKTLNIPPTKLDKFIQ